MSLKNSSLSYPSGWYVLSCSGDLQPGQIVSKTFMGEKIVLFRTESGRIAVVDAYCPHMGAHFGKGGVVRGEKICCPFHGLCFDAEGACSSTKHGHALPRNKKLVKWPAMEVNGFILAYYHPSGALPDWTIPEVDFTGWMPLKTKVFYLKSHPQEITENSVDIGHFSIVHGYRSVAIEKEPEINGPYLTAKYAAKRQATEFGKEKHSISVCFHVHVYGLGYSYVEADVPEFGIKTRHFVQPTPVEGNKIALRVGVRMLRLQNPKTVNPMFRFFPNSFANQMINNMVFKAYLKDVSQDFDIWENKIYLDYPSLLKGDGPIEAYRSWASQFYET